MVSHSLCAQEKQRFYLELQTAVSITDMQFRVAELEGSHVSPTSKKYWGTDDLSSAASAMVRVALLLSSLNCR